jgi:hypothetical protein
MIFSHRDTEAAEDEAELPERQFNFQSSISNGKISSKRETETLMELNKLSSQIIFNVSLVKNGITRIINKKPAEGLA